MADGESFLYEVDETHAAVFSMATKRSVVIPSVTAPIYTAFHEAIGNKIFLNAVEQGPIATEIIGFQYPRLEQVVRWKVPGMVTSLSSQDGTKYYYSFRRDAAAELVEVEPFKHRAHLVGRIRGESIGQSLFVEDGMVVDTVAWTTMLVFRSPGAAPRRVPTRSDVLIASRCGDRIIAATYHGRKADIVWLDEQGRIVARVTEYGSGSYPACSSDGSVIFYGSLADQPGIERCDRGGCRMIFAGPTGWLSISPDDKRLAFTVIDRGGATIRWISSDGTGVVHEITDTENICPPIWASTKDIWVSLRKGHEQVWREIDTNTGRRTGRTFPATRDCADGLPDPQRPVHGPVETEVDVRSRLRLLPSKYLPAEYRSRLARRVR